MGVYKLFRMLPLKTGLGRAVRTFRKRVGLSQEHLADVIGAHRTTIGTIERGLGNPCLSIIAGIAGALGVTVTQLFEAAETEGG